MVNVHTSPIPTGNKNIQQQEQKLSASMENRQQQYITTFKHDKEIIQKHQEAYYDYEDNGEEEEDEYYTAPASVSSNQSQAAANDTNNIYSPSTVLASIVQQKPDDCSPNNTFFYGQQPVNQQHDDLMNTSAVNNSSMRDEEEFYVDTLENHPLASDSPQVEHYIEGVQFLLPVRYEPIECVGKGAYGIVISAVDKLMNRKVAIKKIEAVFKKEKFFQKRIMREIKILIHCKGHPNIVEILDLVPPESFDEFEDIYIVTEYMDCNLQELLKSGQKFSEQNIQYFLYQMLKALDVLHNCDIVHRDIKSSNILVNNDYEVKFCDFGLSRAMMNEKMSTDNVATRWYRSPELLLKYHKAGKPIDVWSLGCVFAELLSTPKQHVLFPGESHLNQIDKILDILGTPLPEDVFGCFKAQVYMSNQPYRKRKDFKKLFPDANPEALDLLEKMLEFSPEKRITVSDSLRQPYLDSMANHMDEDEDANNGFVTRDFEYRFDESWEVPEIKRMMYEEIVNFHNTFSKRF
ncbi:predicted protein [Naegleria gruberi]|uniref:Predicted protein n=1 Tax=Naegleria gruberi TaxID=5762 RepID=D2VZM7_NAEGR|nr:uncharacterized protein NAEGRDRAFT_53537 [Naegleria gruberi]EFC37688.1 predicted protein [Naegleria gruberi]|eukprot:XP_002670432.1 predicted protein [Naegleria gruberi strain NEG-M]